jgi:Ca-activated chloride channel family protein
MSSDDKLPLLKRGLEMMVDQLNENDRVSIVTYAGNAGLVLPPTSGDQKRKIQAAIQNLNSGGSTNGSAGIQLAYDLANQNLIEGSTNRVIWATDGDLNVGMTGDQQLVDLVSERAAAGVFLTVLGFGTGNLKDSKLEKIADRGNGLYAYIDSLREARKVLVEQMSGSLVTIAKDVKLQIEFNPGQVAAWRLIGYENRVLATEDFDNDAKDAGEIGAGHTVTALYELVPAGSTATTASTTSLKYQTATTSDAPSTQAATELSDAADSGDLLTLALRYKLPESRESTRIEYTVKDSETGFEQASTDFRFAASVASFGMLLRGSQHRGNSSVSMVEEIASRSLGSDGQGYRAEFVDMVRRVMGR